MHVGFVVFDIVVFQYKPKTITLGTGETDL